MVIVYYKIITLTNYKKLKNDVYIKIPINNTLNIISYQCSVKTSKEKDL
jgi:hypothetical protein